MSSIETTLLALAAFFFVCWIKISSNKSIVGNVILSLSALALALFFTQLDPFLNQWDERFHALVAKNMLDNPFYPLLYKDMAVSIAYDNWDRYHVWIHKQPLFLWQICLSYFIFGLNEVALRIPSAIMFAFLVVFLCRICRDHFGRIAGILAAVLSLSNYYLLELVAGRAETDHNDLSFVFYISLSFYLWFKYIKNPSTKQAIYIGIAVAAAMLCKWLPGLLVFLTWMIYAALSSNRNPHIKHIMYSLAVALAIALPWQLYTFIRFPEESAFVYIQNAQHLTIALDGHTGDPLYYIKRIDLLFGSWIQYLIIPAIVACYFITNDRRMYWSLLGSLVFVFAFFSFAATKMPSFTLIALPIVVLLTSAFLARIIEHLTYLLPRIKFENVLLFLAIALLFIGRVDVDKIKHDHYSTYEGSYSMMLSYNKELFKNLQLEDNEIVFNVYGRHYIECMYYTDNLAYNFIPDISQIEEIVSKDYEAVVLSDGEEIPDDVSNHESVRIIDVDVKGFW